MMCHTEALLCIARVKIPYKRSPHVYCVDMCVKPHPTDALLALQARHLIDC